MVKTQAEGNPSTAAPKLISISDDPRYQQAAQLLADTQRRRKEAFAEVARWEGGRIASYQLEQARRDIVETTNEATQRTAEVEAIRGELSATAWATVAARHNAAVTEATSRLGNVGRILASATALVDELIAAGYTVPPGMHPQKLKRARFLVGETLKLLAAEG